MSKKGTAKVYRIVARSELGERCAPAFEGMRMETEDANRLYLGPSSGRGPRRPRRSRPRLEQVEVDEMLRVLVVDDRVDFRQAFAAMLEGQPDLEVVAQAGSLAEARTMLEGVDVALLDRGLPDGDGLRLMRPLREANPHARVLVMSATVEMRHPGDAIEAGADGVIDKVGPFERAFTAIRGHGGG